MTSEFTFRAPIWFHDGATSWHFVTLPRTISAQIRNAATGRSKAFGSVRVAATIGETKWKTSIFPDNKSAAYVLPIKASVRQREHLQAGMEVEVFLIVE